MSERVFADDPAIGDDERLFRRIHPTQVVPDEDSGLMRLSSAAFKDPEMSVDLETVLAAHGLPVEACLKGHEGHLLAALPAGGCRRLEQAVCPDPLPDNPAHGIVYGRKKGRIPDRLREIATWVIPPTPPPAR